VFYLCLMFIHAVIRENNVVFYLCLTFIPAVSFLTVDHVQ